MLHSLQELQEPDLQEEDAEGECEKEGAMDVLLNEEEEVNA